MVILPDAHGLSAGDAPKPGRKRVERAVVAGNIILRSLRRLVGDARLAEIVYKPLGKHPLAEDVALEKDTAVHAPVPVLDRLGQAQVVLHAEAEVQQISRLCTVHEIALEPVHRTLRVAVKPELVICDEPVSALDVSIQAQIINLLKELQIKNNLTYMFISHDLSVVKYITDQIMVMYLGNVMEYGDTDEIFDNPLHPYTKALFSAVPVPDPDFKMNRIILSGDIPSPANPPLGCKFHTRCKECMNVCKFKEPEYLEVKPNHFVNCHLFNEEVMNNLEEYDRQYEEMLAQEKEEENNE